MSDWISIKEKDIPEGIKVDMKNDITGKEWQDLRYSSLPKPYQVQENWVTHWMPLLKPPNND